MSWIPTIAEADELGCSRACERLRAVDVLKCPRCLKGTLAVLAYIKGPKVVLKILTHLHLPAELPTPSPARRSSIFEDVFASAEGLADSRRDDLESEADHGQRPRAPP